MHAVDPEEAANAILSLILATIVPDYQLRKNRFSRAFQNGGSISWDSPALIKYGEPICILCFSDP